MSCEVSEEMHVLNLAPLPSLRSFAAGLIERSRRLSALTAALNSLVIDENNEILDRKKRKRSTDIRHFLTDVRVAMQESTEAVVYDEYLVDDLQNIVKRGEQLLQPDEIDQLDESQTAEIRASIAIACRALTNIKALPRRTPLVDVVEALTRARSALSRTDDLRKEEIDAIWAEAEAARTLVSLYLPYARAIGFSTDAVEKDLNDLVKSMDRFREGRDLPMPMEEDDAAAADLAGGDDDGACGAGAAAAAAAAAGAGAGAAAAAARERARDEKYYQVAALLSRRQLVGKELQFLVKWYGYGSVYNTWEPISALPQESLDDYQTHHEENTRTDWATRITSRASALDKTWLYNVEWENGIKSYHAASALSAKIQAFRPEWFVAVPVRTVEADEDKLSDEDEPPLAPGAGASQLTTQQEDEPLPPTPPSLVWDAGTGRARLSVAKAVRNLVDVDSLEVLRGLEEWVSWRLYLLHCAVVPDALQKNDELMQRLAGDLYEIRRDFFVSLFEERSKRQQGEVVTYAAFRSERLRLLRQRFTKRWRKAQLRLARDKPTLEAQQLALKYIREHIISDARDYDTDRPLDGAQQTNATLVMWAKRGAWWQTLARPRARPAIITDFLSNEGRGKRTNGVLAWWRARHTESGEVERTDGVFGSYLSGDWPLDPTPTLCPPDHVTPQQWQLPSELLMENAQSRQNISTVLLALRADNSERGAKALDCFGEPSADFARANRRAYTPAASMNTAKRQMAARSVLHGHLSYALLSDTTSTAGEKTFRSSSGIGFYRPVVDNIIAMASATTKPSDLEVRTNLVFAAEYGTCNPLALDNKLLVKEQRFAELFRRRIGTGKEGEGLATIVDRALSASVYLAPS